MTSRLTTNVVAGLLALALVSVMIVRTSQAAFTGTTDQSANSFAAGTVILSDNDSGSALLSVSNMKPGDSTQACVEVSYDGTLVGSDINNIRFYSGGSFTDSDAIADDLDLDVDWGSGTATNCSDFSETTADLVTETLTAWEARTSWSVSAVDTGWQPAATSETRTFRITVTLGTDTPDTSQGDSLTAVDFIWEAQSA